MHFGYLDDFFIHFANGCYLTPTHPPPSLTFLKLSQTWGTYPEKKTFFLLGIFRRGGGGLSEFLGVNQAMPERKHFFRISSLKLNSRKERIPLVSCLEFFLPHCFFAPMKSAMLFLYIVTKHSVIVLPSLTEGEGGPFLLQNLVKVEFLSVFVTRAAASRF